MTRVRFGAAAGSSGKPPARNDEAEQDEARPASPGSDGAAGPAGRAGGARCFVHLTSPYASATTGGAVRVDGGYVDSILP
ncbi:hypothetical protein ACIQ6Y_17445 [Streptomyces sp. NPDC096205]|uniref:hypothetical protein n=1 Tax=Streptomyces sp. NPDC096205 TaxID=3366081 RepID=UPI003828A43C